MSLGINESFGPSIMTLHSPCMTYVITKLLHITQIDGDILNMALPSEQPSVHYLYREKTHPCFLWTLALAPCLMPTVWYVTDLSKINLGQFAEPRPPPGRDIDICNTGSWIMDHLRKEALREILLARISFLQ
jgi:hypothetical protein